MGSLSSALAQASQTLSGGTSSGGSGSSVWQTVGPVQSGSSGLTRALDYAGQFIGLGLQTYGAVQQIRGGNSPQPVTQIRQTPIYQTPQEDPAAIALSTNRGLQGNLNIPPIILYGVGAILLVKLLGGKK